jgi:hypothetical protein
LTISTSNNAVAALTILEAIDHLNSWVRSDSARGWHSSPRYAIYDWKHAAIQRAIKDGTARCDAIYLTLNCRDCGGTGKYIDSYGEKFPRCRRCSNSGHSTLLFLTTAIGDIRWHTPHDKCWRFNLPEDFWQSARLSVDWEPNQKGRDLELWEVAECLNVLEEAVERGELPKPGSHGVYDRSYWIGDSDHGKYRLDLGRSERVCEICSTPAVAKDAERGLYDGVHHHVTREHVEFSAWACYACKALYATVNRWCDVAKKYVPDGGNGKSIFDEFKIPIERCQHPEVRKWLERRAERKAV